MKERAFDTGKGWSHREQAQNAVKKSDLEKKLSLDNHQTQVQEKNSKEHIKKIVRRKTVNYKSSKQVEKLNQ